MLFFLSALALATWGPMDAKGYSLTPAATRYRVVSDGGRSWFVGPDGRRFLSFGVCVVDQGQSPEKYNAKNPAYSALRSYPSTSEWAKDTVSRLQGWGFNTIGAASDSPNLRKVDAPNLLFTPVLHIGASAGAPGRDMWDPKTVKVMDQVARDGIRDLGGGNRRVIGYFSDNEIGWWEGTLLDSGFKAGPGSRSRLIALLRKTYASSWTALKRDFDPQGAASFSQLAKKGRLFLHSGGNGMQVVKAWAGIVAERYYTICQTLINRYDPGALYLGDRYISNFYPEVARAAARHVDVVSTNLNADWNDGRFAPFFLPALRRITQKPILVTEYYVAAMENRSGNRNDHSGFPVVKTQADRAAVFKTSTETLLRTPFVVGAHWFQYYDEPKNGRDDGENYNLGLVDVENRPYEEVTAAAREMARFTSPGSEAPPVAAARPFRIPTLPKTADPKDLGTWPRDAAWVAPAGNADRGDLYAATDGKSIYLALYWNEDRFAGALYRNGKVPRADRALLTVGAGHPVLAYLGEGGIPELGGAVLISHQEGVRNFAILRLPLTKRPLDVKLDTRGRAYTMRWRVKVTR